MRLYIPASLSLLIALSFVPVGLAGEQCNVVTCADVSVNVQAIWSGPNQFRVYDAVGTAIGSLVTGSLTLTHATPKACSGTVSCTASTVAPTDAAPFIAHTGTMVAAGPFVATDSHSVT